MTARLLYKVLIYCIAAVWLINGLLCKVMNLVPRHTQIVERILGVAFARPLTIAIGIAEIGMAIWIVAGIKPKFCALTQILIVGIMNIIEFMIVRDLLLWGKFNILFAAMFVIIVYYTEFVLHKRLLGER